MAANPSIQLGTDGNWAIKEDNLLAYKKDGTRFFNKQFDFTRGSLATFVDKDGLIKVSGVTSTELVTNGDFATDSDWTLGTGITISNGKANFTGNANTFLTQSGVVSSGKTYKATFTVSNYVSGAIDINLGGSTRQGNVSANGTYTFNISVSSGNILYFQEDFSNGFVGSITNVSVKEIQLDVPRIDFTNDTKGHLLLEPQSTNLITYSEDFSQSSWVKLGAGTGSVAVVTSNYAISPEGTKNASRLQCNLNGGSTTSDQSLIYDLDATNSTKTISVYMKSNNSQNQTIYFTNTFTGDSTDEALVTTQWQRFTFTHSTSNHTFSLGLRGGTGADDIADILIFAAQAEALSFPTSYIPTSGSTVTRNAEVCNNSGSAQDFNDSEGVLYCEIAALANYNLDRLISLSNGTTSNVVKIGFLSSATNYTIVSEVRSGAVLSAYMTYNFGAVTPTITKIAIKYKENDFALWVDGVERATDTNGSVPTVLNKLSFDRGDGAQDFEGKVKSVVVFKEALTDTQLTALTAQ